MRRWIFPGVSSCGGAAGQVRHHVWRADVEEGLHPDFKCEELPNLHGPILGAASMLVHQPADSLGTEQATFTNPRLGEKVVGHFFQVMGQPVVNRRRKTSFRLRQHLTWQDIFHRLAEYIFGGGPKESFELQSWWNVPGHELGQLAVQKRDPNFDR